MKFVIFCRYGEVVDVNLVKDKGTGKSKGFAFLAYEDQRSTILAVGQFLKNICICPPLVKYTSCKIVCYILLQIMLANNVLLFNLLCR